MQHVIQIGQDGAVVTIKTYGDGSPEGIIAFLEDLISHPEWQKGANVLLDHRELSIDSITVEGIERVAGFFVSIADQLGDGKLALVMNRDIDFGIARAWELVTATEVDMQIRVFKRIDDAKCWLQEGDQEPSALFIR